MPGLHPDRAPTIVAGVTVLLEVLATFGLDGVEVSEHDILWGVALEEADNAVATSDRSHTPHLGGDWTFVRLLPQRIPGENRSVGRAPCLPLASPGP